MSAGPIPFLRSVLDIPYHHERWDGGGYPDGLEGPEIHLAARIFTVVDHWEALSSDRPYRDAWDRERIERYMRDNSGIHFDPHILGVFLERVVAGGEARDRDPGAGRPPEQRAVSRRRSPGTRASAAPPGRG